MSNLKLKIIVGVVIIGIISVLIFLRSSSVKTPTVGISSQSEPTNQKVPADAKPQIVSTKPEPLEDTIISANEVIEIAFNRPLENVGEFKVRIEPPVEYKLELSGDRKTGKIIPIKPYPLGATFTLFIGPETKFDGVGRWGEEKIFHFRTIRYTGV